MQSGLNDIDFHRYFISLSKGGKIINTFWRENRFDAEQCRLDYGNDYEVSISDFTAFDDLTGYSAFREAKILMGAYPHAVYCLTSKRAYKSFSAAYKSTGDTRFYIKQSCIDGKPTPSGKIWRKLND